MIVPTLHFTSCSSSVTFSDPLRFKSNTININSLNSFGKPIANSTDNNNDHHRPFETASEVLYSENYFLKTNQNELTSNTPNPQKSINDTTANNTLFLSNMEDFYKLKYDSDESLRKNDSSSSSCSPTASLSVIPILCQKSTNQIDTNTFSFELKRLNSTEKSLMNKKHESGNNLDSALTKESPINSDSKKTIDEADKHEIIEYRNTKELLLMPSNYYLTPVTLNKTDLHGQLLQEIQTKTIERSLKEMSMHLDEQGNLINNELNKLVSRNSISDSIEVIHAVESDKYKIRDKSIRFDDGTPESMTASVTNTFSNKKQAELENENNKIKQKSKFTLPSKIPIKLSSSTKTAEVHKLNSSTMTMPATISNAASRSMLSEAKFKLEAFSKLNKINNNNNKTNQPATIPKTFGNDFQTKF
jgi:hypothetical protein